MKTVGQKPYYLHIAGEISRIGQDSLKFENIDDNFQKTLSNLGINVIKTDYHEFSGGGLSVVYILSASHLAIHTWPELGFIHFDLVTCSPDTQFKQLVEELNLRYPEATIKAVNLDYSTFSS